MSRILIIWVLAAELALNSAIALDWNDLYHEVPDYERSDLDYDYVNYEEVPTAGVARDGEDRPVEEGGMAGLMRENTESLRSNPTMRPMTTTSTTTTTAAPTTTSTAQPTTTMKVQNTYSVSEGAQVEVVMSTDLTAHASTTGAPLVTTAINRVDSKLSPAPQDQPKVEAGEIMTFVPSRQGPAGTAAIVSPAPHDIASESVEDSQEEPSQSEASSSKVNGVIAHERANYVTSGENAATTILPENTAGEQVAASGDTSDAGMKVGELPLKTRLETAKATLSPEEETSTTSGVAVDPARSEHVSTTTSSTLVLTSTTTPSTTTTASTTTTTPTTSTRRVRRPSRPEGEDQDKVGGLPEWMVQVKHWVSDKVLSKQGQLSFFIIIGGLAVAGCAVQLHVLCQQLFCPDRRQNRQAGSPEPTGQELRPRQARSGRQGARSEAEDRQTSPEGVEMSAIRAPFSPLPRSTANDNLQALDDVSASLSDSILSTTSSSLELEIDRLDRRLQELNVEVQLHRSRSCRKQQQPPYASTDGCQGRPSTPVSLPSPTDSMKTQLNMDIPVPEPHVLQREMNSFKTDHDTATATMVEPSSDK